MSNLQDYNEKLPVITAIPDDEKKSPSMPVDVYAQEAEDQHTVANGQLEKFEKLGFNLELITDLPKRCGALRESESNWQSLFRVKQESQQKWQEESPRAYYLRDDLLDVLRYAFRKQPDLLKKVRAISEGRGHADMIQDLNDIAVSARNNKGYIDAINYDIAEFEKAAEIADSMAAILSESRNESGISEAKIIRDKAYTHVKEAVDEIRETGKFIFRYDPEMEEKFASNYTRSRNRDSRQTPDEQAPDLPNN